jgi:large subunit ribosomal protein L14
MVGQVLNVIDNSGARRAMCIKVLKKNPKCRARLGDYIIVVVKRATPGKKVRTHQIHRALLVRDSKPYYRKQGAYIKFSQAACVILKKDGQPLAKRIHGPVCKEIREMGHIKIISLSSLAL